MNKLTPDYKDQSPYEQAKDLASRGLSSEEIKRTLMERGVDAESAGVLAGTVGARAVELDIGAMTEGPRPRSGGKRWNPENFVVGTLMCMGGVFFSMVSCSSMGATERTGGTTHWLKYGALIASAACFVAGLARRG